MSTFFIGHRLKLLEIDFRELLNCVIARTAQINLFYSPDNLPITLSNAATALLELLITSIIRFSLDIFSPHE